MQNAGGASSNTEIKIRTSVASDRAHVMTSGVSKPATTSVLRSAATLPITEPGRGASPPTVALPIPLKMRIVKRTTLNP